MKITVFTSNQPRHVSLIEGLSSIADQVYAIQECNTVFPGRVEDFFRKSDVMQKYFNHVIAAEREVFGDLKFTSDNVTQLSLKSGDINMIDLETLSPALNSDYYIVFGASYIKGGLCDFLVKQGAINIHMGVSPYYRGNSCNFWALYDGNPELVGATIHLLSKGLDSGDILYHAFPKPESIDPFVLGMKAVKSAHDSLIENIQSGIIKELVPSKQNKESEIRYTRNKDFHDEVAKDYLENLPAPVDLKNKLEQRDINQFLYPYVG
ncbi:Methionyl-tRNA formyltransferase [Paenibacillus uliginis N3/975]|uniref:Methionyl-tRNA formyltransferase n=1 Tax=Paenibacillus uliginis N3/975 TaxID=1313296 RepID=A0A1X7GCL8_9BACL|nr:formyltransferase family protein [Paenibacillus uliginis]SMF67541.1 Methionyl-tRNA formyltransferase [Paenibacillus uliginis N3/975]